jgi:hypothetical protein
MCCLLPSIVFAQPDGEPVLEPRARLAEEAEIMEEEPVKKKVKEPTRAEIIRKRVAALKLEYTDCKTVDSGLKKIQRERDEKYEKYRTIEKTYKTDRKALLTEIKRLKREEGEKKSITRINTIKKQIKTLGMTKLDAFHDYNESYVIYGELWSMSLNCMMGTADEPASAIE